MKTWIRPTPPGPDLLIGLSANKAAYVVYGPFSFSKETKILLILCVSYSELLYFPLSGFKRFFLELVRT